MRAAKIQNRSWAAAGRSRSIPKLRPNTSASGDRKTTHFSGLTNTA